MIEGYAHQVAGHKEEALLGIEKRLVLKPLVKKDLFARESTFYVKSSEARHDTNSVLCFTAGFYGILYCNSCRDPCTLSPAAQEERARNNSLLPHIVLEDLTYGYTTPSVIDIKMGTCTYEPTAAQKKKDSEHRKYPYQEQLGFRVTGFKVYDCDSSSYVQAGKPFGRSILPSEVVPALALLFRCGCSGGSFRIDVIKSVIRQLECILLWMRSQTRYKFYCTSVLVVFDAHVDAHVAVHTSESANCTADGTSGGDGGCEQAVDEQKGDGAGSSIDALSAGNANGNTTSASSRAAELTRKLCRDSNNHEVLQNIDNFLQTTPEEPPLVRVKMIDFAHVVECENGDNPGTLDEGYIHGLTMLIRSLHCVLDCVAGGECSIHENIAMLLQRARDLEP